MTKIIVIYFCHNRAARACVCARVCVREREREKQELYSELCCLGYNLSSLLLYDWCLATVFSVYSTSAFRVDVEDTNVTQRSPGVVAGAAALANSTLAKQTLIYFAKGAAGFKHVPLHWFQPSTKFDVFQPNTVELPHIYL